MLLVNNLTFAYEKTKVLHGISFEMQSGDWLGLLGPNGSGKTTLIKCLSRSLKPQHGTIELDGKLLNSYSHNDLAQKIAVVPQDSNIPFPFTAFEVVLMGRISYQKRFGFETKQDLLAAKKALEATETLQFANRPINELSGGERQRVIIARALSQEPKVLLMDEATSSLDIKHQQDILRLVKKLNKETGLTVVSAMHDINLALLYCKNIMLIKNGYIHKLGPTNEVVTYTNLKMVFDTEVYVGINDLNGRPYYLPY